MNTKTITTSVLTGVVASFLVASSASAFWPFDALFKKKGDVKAATSQAPMYENGSRADQIYKAIVSMDEACSKVVNLSAKPTGLITPRTTTTERTVPTKEGSEIRAAGGVGGTVSNTNELEAIYTQLKARCENIKRLRERMARIYKSPPMVTVTSRPVSVTPTRKPLFNFGTTRPEQREKPQQ